MFTLEEIRYLIDSALYDELVQRVSPEEGAPLRYAQFAPLATQQVRAACGHTEATLALPENAKVREEIMPAYAWIVELLAQSLLSVRSQDYQNIVQGNYRNARAILSQITAPEITVDSDSTVKVGQIKVAKW